MSPISALAGAAGLAFENFLAGLTINFLHNTLGSACLEIEPRGSRLSAPRRLQLYRRPALFEESLEAANCFRELVDIARL
jgi:hypothetical protein